MSEHEHNHEHHHEHEHDHCCCCGHDHGHSHEHEHEEDGMSLKKLILAGLLLAVGIFLEHFDLSPFFDGIKEAATYQKYALAVVCLGAYLIVGRDVVKEAILNLFHGKIFDEEFLMAVASLGAVCVGELPEAVAIMLFYQIGERFEDYAVDKSKDSIESLMEICPDTATVIRDGKEVEVKAEEVQIGETIVVRPGERIPVDGKIVEGSSFIDNSALTGESVPVEATTGAEVFSGAINKSAVIKITTVRMATDSAASRILNLVQSSSEKKTKTERFISRFSRVYTPIVCALALTVAIIPALASGLVTGNFLWSTWIHRGLMFLVVSCPCAIVISIPLTFFGGIGAASRKGILLKGSSSIDSLCRTKIAVFDKTGTLTKGVFEVTEICPATKDVSQDQLLEIAAHAEAGSNHPVALSLMKAHKGECCSKTAISDQQEIAGRGIKVCLNGKTILAGNSLLIEENNVSGYDKVCALNKAGTVIHLAQDNQYLGHIVISDEVKADSLSALKDLKRLGVEKTVMLTGDSKAAAEKTAEALGLDQVYAELLPEDKVTKVEEMLSELKEKNSKGTLCFAGDGINDAPVLARADIGIAMGGLGSDAAIESADVVIMTDEPGKIAEAIKLSRRTINIVYQNIIFSLGVKVLIMALSGFGIGSMWMAVFGDVGVTFLAILNSMRAQGSTRLSELKK